MVDEEPMEGDFPLTNCARYAGEWPQLCEVLKKEDIFYTVHWYKGSKTGPWTPCTKPVIGLRGKREPLTEVLNKEDI